MNIHQLIDQLAVNGGAIVSSSECSEMEISDAQSTGRFAVLDDGMGFVRRHKEWLALQKTREIAHPNTGSIKPLRMDEQTSSTAQAKAWLESIQDLSDCKRF